MKKVLVTAADIPVLKKFLDCEPGDKITIRNHDGKIHLKRHTKLDQAEQIAIRILCENPYVKKATFVHRGYLTVCTVITSKGSIYVGYARKSPNDEYRISLGEALAFGRAIGLDTKDYFRMLELLY